MKKYDLTEGSILGKLLLVAIPIMGVQLLQMTYNFTDMFWLGRLGSDAVASSGTAGMYMWLSMAFLYLGRMGSEIGVSQNLGRKDEKSAYSFSQNALFISIVLGILCTIIAVFFNKELIAFFNIKEKNVAEDSAKYLAIVGVACPATFITAAIAGTFTGAGNSKIAFYANLVGLIINMSLDPLLIFTFKMEVVGAAVATAIAQFAVCIIFLVAIKKNKNRPFKVYKFFKKPSIENIKDILKWSLPIAIESLFFTLLAMITTRFVTDFGTNAISVQKVGSQVESLSWLIGGGFGSALTSFIGQNFGANKWGRINKGFKMSLAAMSLWGVIVTIILYFFGGFLFSLFLPDPELIKMGEVYLKIFSACQLSFCFEAVSAGIFRGTGRTLPPSFVSVTSNALRVPLAYFLSKTSLGLDGIWWGITIGAILRGFWIFIWYLIQSKKEPKYDVNELQQIA